MRIGPVIAFRGATMYELAIGALYVGVLRPSFLNRRSWRRLVRIGWESADVDAIRRALANYKASDRVKRG